MLPPITGTIGTENAGGLEADGGPTFELHDDHGQVDRGMWPLIHLRPRERSEGEGVRGFTVVLGLLK